MHFWCFQHFANVFFPPLDIALQLVLSSPKVVNLYLMPSIIVQHRRPLSHIVSCHPTPSATIQHRWPPSYAVHRRPVCWTSFATAMCRSPKAWLLFWHFNWVSWCPVLLCCLSICLILFYSRVDSDSTCTYSASISILFAWVAVFFLHPWCCWKIN